MQRPADIEVIFPIKDAASAALMAIKADSLYKAGIISEREKRWVDARLRTFLNDAPAPRPLKRNAELQRTRGITTAPIASPCWPQTAAPHCA
jgi:hypothetical protein